VEVTYRALGDHVSLLIFLRINHLALMSLFHFLLLNCTKGHDLDILRLISTVDRN